MLGLHPSRSNEPLRYAGLPQECKEEERVKAVNEYFSKMQVVLELDKKNGAKIKAIGEIGIDLTNGIDAKV
jgi:soluble P-type ATPase